MLCSPELHQTTKDTRIQQRSATMIAVQQCLARNTLFLATVKGLCVHIDVIVLKAMCNVQVWHVDGQAQTKHENHDK